jgi:hypothetical protein
MKQVTLQEHARNVVRCHPRISLICRARGGNHDVNPKSGEAEQSLSGLG